MRNPEVITGARGPRQDAVAAASNRVEPDRSIPEGKVVFQFIADRYFLQLNAGKQERTADGRLITVERPIKVIADDGFKILDTVKDADVIALVRGHESFGRDFWDYSTVLADARKAKEDQALAVIQHASPETRKKLVEMLKQMGEDDFQLPKQKGSKPSKTEANEA